MISAYYKMTSGAKSALVVVHICMMTSSNGNIFREIGPLCGEFTGPGEFPTQRPVTRSFDVFFDLRLNKALSKQSWGWWFETLSRSLWRHRKGLPKCNKECHAWKVLFIYWQPVAECCCPASGLWLTKSWLIIHNSHIRVHCVPHYSVDRRVFLLFQECVTVWPRSARPLYGPQSNRTWRRFALGIVYC